MTIEAQTEAELKELQEKVRLAREWAKEHFHADKATEDRIVDEDMNLFPPSFFVEFPAIDTMMVTPSAFGQRSLGLNVMYRLSFKKGGGVVWRPQPPFGHFASFHLQFDNGIAVVEDVSDARRKLITALLGIMAQRSLR